MTVTVLVKLLVAGAFVVALSPLILIAAAFLPFVRLDAVAAGAQGEA